MSKIICISFKAGEYIGTYYAFASQANKFNFGALLLKSELDCFWTNVKLNFKLVPASFTLQEAKF